MSDKPILFSAPMVRALLAGKKTQTRRMMKEWPPAERRMLDYAAEERRDETAYWVGGVALFPPRFAIGDRLWVREAHGDAGMPGYGHVWFYRADPETPLPSGFKWRPSIHMPRSASRLTLHVTDVRVQRLQEISNEDCIAEGVPVDPNAHAPRTGPIRDDFARKHGLISHYGAEYRRIWKAINGPGSWEANPWVAAYTFTVERCNIDQARSP